VDGNVWSSSGVSAGIDVTLAWIGDVYGEEVTRRIANGMEYTRHEDSGFDPFAELYGL
jgi:transcriptional regulator GlxA family with amidase domain